MCGLVGMVGTLEYKHKKAMKDLLFLNSLRGRDSTGISCVHRNRTVSTRKMTIPGYEFIDHPAVDKAMEYNDQLWIGHGRFKTQGDITKANAHPFEVLDDDEEHILMIGAHNGTLNNKYEIERLTGKKFDTDSEGIFNLLVQQPNFKEAIGKLRGAYALTFWDPTTDKIHFIRNQERPLVFAFTDDRRVMVWASEAWMLINACLRNDIKLAKNENEKSCYLFSSDTMYSLEIPQAKDRALPELQKEGGYEGAKEWGARFQGQNRYTGYGAWYDHLGDDDDDEFGTRYAARRQETKQETGKETEKETGKAGKDSAKSQIEIDLFDPKTHVRGFEGAIITRQEVEECKKAGCIWCGGEVNNLFAWYDEKGLVCGACLRDDHPKSSSFRERDLDDDLPPFDLSENSEEYKRVMASAVKKAR